MKIEGGSFSETITIDDQGNEQPTTALKRKKSISPDPQIQKLVDRNTQKHISLE